MWRRQAKASGGSSPAMHCSPSLTTSDNAEPMPYETRTSMSFAVSNRDYPVLGISFPTFSLKVR